MLQTENSQLLNKIRSFEKDLGRKEEEAKRILCEITTQKENNGKLANRVSSKDETITFLNCQLEDTTHKLKSKEKTI